MISFTRSGLLALTLSTAVIVFTICMAGPASCTKEAADNPRLPHEEPDTAGVSAETWTFVSIPDFLNVDTTYPQPGWEDALDYVLEAVKAESPDFVLVPGDLVMGRWWSEEKIEKYAAIYYPAWIRRMEAHGLRFYAALGDHEIGDNPWPPHRARLVPAFRRSFRQYLEMPSNGPEGLEGTAYYFVHRNTLFVSVDVFETGEGLQGDIVIRVTGSQLEWFKETLDSHSDVDHIIVMGHTPILGPVRQETSSGLMLEDGRRSPLWRAMVIGGVDLYLCGEVHAVTCIERDRVQQVAHGGLFGYNPRVNYLIARVSPTAVELEIKEIDIVCEGDDLPQEGPGGPSERVHITDEARERGFTTIGTMVINKSSGKKATEAKTGCFTETDNPRE
jgi:3',5'-cyclic AMP phosphodiesterase CpdA